MLKKDLKLLAIDFSEEDTRFLSAQLKNIQVLKCIDRIPDIRAALSESDWDVLLFKYDKSFHDYRVALELLKDSGKDIPFIIYSSDVDEDTVLSAIYSGVSDYVPKGDPLRLVYAVEKEIANAEIRHIQNKTEDPEFRLACYDELTGLPDRRLFFYQASALLAEQSLPNVMAALYVIHLERLPYIGDIYGTDMANRVIQQLSGRFNALVSEHCLLARTSNDQFAMFRADAADRESVQTFANELVRLAMMPVVIDQLEFDVQAMIGVSMHPASGDSISTRMAHAVGALSYNRDLWKHHCSYYSKEIEEAAAKQSELERSLRYAIQREEFLLYYQPVVDLRSGALTGIEALLRWNHPQLGVLPPEKFMFLAQESGLIMEIGRWVLQRACQQIKTWHRAGYEMLPVSVNLSAIEFDQASLVNTISQLLTDTGLPSQLLELEISEPILMRDAEKSLQRLQQLKSLGVRVAVDNFGTGYTSLRYLKHFSIDILKIDRSLIHAMMADPDNSVIVLTMAGLAKNLGLAVHAVGIETKEQFDFLCQLDCDRAQGYLFSKPQSVNDVLQFLAQRRTVTFA